MDRSKLIACFSSKVPTRKSLGGNLQLLTSAVFVVLTVIFVTGYSYISSKLAHEERMESARALGSTLSRLVARPVSMGDYVSVEQSLRGSSLQDFICAIRIVTASEMSVASVGHQRSSLCTDKNNVISVRFPIITASPLDPVGERQVGSVLLNIGLADLRVARIRSILAALMSGGALMFVLLILNRIAVDWALLPLARAVTAASSTTSQDFDQTRKALNAAPSEIQPLLEKLVQLSADYAKADGDIRVAKVARQVAHDIRSPLAALEMSSTSRNIPESERVIIRQATTRIRDIANDLSGRFRESPATSAAESGDHVAPQLIPVLIDEIVTEMRLRFRSRRGLEITANLDESNYGLFAAVDPVTFRRALSNLIQNAVEAIADNGKVEIHSEARGEKAIIEVIDNGHGIPDEVLPHLGNRGATFGRANGSGLGLHYAKQVVETWNGSIEINSEVGKGTTVRMVLPVANAPEWFVPRLELPSGSHIVVLDDDQSIHQVWSERLSKWLEANSVKLLHFTSSDEFRLWFNANEEVARRSRYLVDFELIGEKDTGLSLVEALQIQEKSILVTSRYDELAVRTPCERNRIRLIPKGLAAFVPIHIENREISAVLIDDDTLTHQVWNHVAEQAGRRVLTLFTDGDIDSHSVPDDTPIYVDRTLESGLSGEDVLKRLHRKGFNNLYLFTGDIVERSALPELSFIKGIVGKNIPAEVYGRV